MSMKGKMVKGVGVLESAGVSKLNIPLSSYHAYQGMGWMGGENM